MADARPPPGHQKDLRARRAPRKFYKLRPLAGNFFECSSLWASESLRECLPKLAVEVTARNFLHDAIDATLARSIMKSHARIRVPRDG